MIDFHIFSPIQYSFFPKIVPFPISPALIVLPHIDHTLLVIILSSSFPEDNSCQNISPLSAEIQSKIFSNSLACSLVRKHYCYFNGANTVCLFRDVFLYVNVYMCLCVGVCVPKYTSEWVCVWFRCHMNICSKKLVYTKTRVFHI